MVVGLVQTLFVSTGSGGGTKPPVQDLNYIALEIMAMQSLDGLELRPTQTQALIKLARSTSDQGYKPAPAKVSKEYRKLLLKLHAALILRNDQVDQLDSDLEELADKEDPELDTEYALTDAARGQAPEFLKLLSPGQIAHLLATGDQPDPTAILEDALDSGRDLKGDDWKETRDEAAAEAGKLLAGLDKEEVRKMSAKLSGLLDELHRNKQADAAALHARLDAEVRALMGPGGAFDVLRHSAEYSLADLLSNPGLAPALEARRRAGKL
jgi:hypothetical protein